MFTNERRMFPETTGLRGHIRWQRLAVKKNDCSIGWNAGFAHGRCGQSNAEWQIDRVAFRTAMFLE